MKLQSKYINRRSFIKLSSLIFGYFIFKKTIYSFPKNIMFSMPEESSNHKKTWMSFVANDYIWSKKQIPEVKKNLILIAKTISKYEPVSMLVNPYDYQEASLLLGNTNLLNYPIELIPFEIDDLWLRDTAPIFVTGSDGKQYGIDFNFNAWGEKQEYTRDAKVAKFIIKKSNVNFKKTNLVIEGGGFEVDGHGTAILTKSCVLNDNRNPHLDMKEIEAELKTLLGIRKIIWLNGIKGKDITDAHTDFYVRFIKKGQVIVHRDNDKYSYDYQVTRENIKILQNSVDAEGNQLDLIILDTPNIVNLQYGIKDFAAGYIGYYLCNQAVIIQKFGDEKADKIAKNTIAKAFPNRKIEQIQIDGIASGGGSIHCTTQQQPQL